MTYATMFKSGGNSENLRSTFNDLRDFVMACLIGNKVVTDPGLVIGSSAPEKVKTGAAFTAYVLGMPYANASSEIAFTATTHDIADGYTNIFNVEVPAGTNGTLVLTIGTAALIGSDPTPAAVTAAHALLGTVQVSASGDTFDASTDSLAETWITAVYTDKDYASLNAISAEGFNLTAI